tara:strand:- start:721 stop:1524 length:804 start_codon:yes stop_codon:yes gene_type:complete
MQQNLAPQDNLILSGFLNSFKWNGQNQRSAWVYLAIGEKDMNDNRVYNSVLVQVYGNVARMLAAKQQERQNAKAQGQRMQVLVQITSGMVSSFTQQDQQGNDMGAPVTFIKGFKASIVNTQDRSIIDDSDNPIYAEQGGNQGGYPQNNAPANNAPQGNYNNNNNYNNQGNHNQGNYQPQNNAPANNAPQGNYNNNQGNQGNYQPQNNAPVNNEPQNNQGNNQGNYQPQNNAPVNNAPQNNNQGNQGNYQPQNPNGNVDDDFDDDIPF